MGKKKTKTKRKRSKSVGQKGHTGSSPRPTGGEETPNDDAPVGNRPEEHGRVYNAARSVREVDTTIRAIPSNPTYGEAAPKWPYTTIDGVDQYEDFTTWFQNTTLGDEWSSVGLATLHDGLYLATKDSGIFVTLAQMMGRPGASVVTKQLLASGGPKFISRDVTEDVSFLVGVLQLSVEDEELLLDKFAHDIGQLSYATGTPYLRRGEITGIKDALDAATVGVMMSVNAPKYYTRIGMPLLQHTYLADASGIETSHRWTIIYDYLIFKVAAQYTQDPSIKQWLIEGKDPLMEFASVCELDKKEALPFFLWLLCGEDMNLMQREHSASVPHMPDNPQMVKAMHIDKRIPSFRMGIIQMMEEFQRSRKAETFWGRISPSQLSPAELLHFAIFGSVQDLLDIVVVSINTAGSNNHVLVSDEETGYANWLRARIVGYTERNDIQEWQRYLEDIATLGEPIPSLNPKVLVE